MLSSFERLIVCWVLTGTIILGFVVPGLSEMFAPLAFGSLLCMIILSLVPMGRLDLNQIFSLDWGVWKIVFWQLFILPAIIVAAATRVHLEGSVVALLVTTASAGSLFASPTFAELLQVNKQKALQCMILSTFLMPISYFVFFTLVLHSHVNLEMVNFAKRCIMFLILPFAVFLIYMGISRCLKQRIVLFLENSSRRLTILALMFFGLGIVGPARDLMWHDPRTFILYLLIVTCLGAGMASFTTIIMYRQGLTDALTASIVSGFRNVGLGFVLLSGFSSQTTAAYVGVSQIPIFLAPLVFSYLVRKKHEQATAQPNLSMVAAE